MYLTLYSRVTILISMKTARSHLLKKFTSSGVLTRDRVKNDLKEVTSLVRHGLVKKVYKQKRVFYELTVEALSLLNHVRLELLEEAALCSKLYPRRKEFYLALLQDVRFFDTSKKEAKNFMFLGDWRLNMPPTQSQLELSQLRFYQEQGSV
jgi:hypothetical protein